MPQPIELYFWPTPNGQKISVALEEMGLPYVLKPVNIGQGEQFEPSFLKISPNNRMPAIIDPDGPGQAPVSVFESGAILQYLGRKSGKFYPNDERARIVVDEWLMWQMGGLGPMLGQASHFINYAPQLVDDPAKVAYGLDRYTKEADRLFGVLDRRLNGRDFIADEVSIADFASFPWVSGVRKFGLNPETFPNVKAWLDRMEARPGVARGMEVGADLRKPLPEKGTPEAERLAKAMFGQTAQSTEPKSKDG